jgi:DNA-binding FadR family transcriptional regulator
MIDALERIAALAPDLKESEVRVLIEMSRRVATTSSHTVTISTRDLAEATKVSRSNIKPAITSLNKRGIITSDKGSATVAATHELKFLKTVRLLRGPVTGPPQSQQVGLFQAQGGPVMSPPVDLLQAQGGPTPSPPHIQRAERADTSSNFDFDSIQENIDRHFARLLKAKPNDYDAARLKNAEEEMHGYQAKFGRLPNPHPPDAQLCAQLLAVAEWPRLKHMFYDLMAERKKPGESYAWYVTVAVQRCWSITPEQQRKYREQFALIKSGQRRPAAKAAAVASCATPAPAPTEFGVGDLQAAIRTAAAGKAMR